MLLLPSELPYLKELRKHGLRLIEMAPAEIIGSLVGGKAQGGSLSQHAKDAASTLQLKCEQRVANEGGCLHCSPPFGHRFRRRFDGHFDDH